MPKRVRVTEASASEAGPREDQLEDPPMEIRRTRSGRTLRPPAALLAFKTPVKTPSRRTRRSVLPDVQAAVDETNTDDKEQQSESPVQEKSSSIPTEPDSAEPTETTEPKSEPESGGTDPADGGGEPQVSTPAPVETVPASSEAIPKKKPHLAPNAKQFPAVPLGKPKSGRVWKDRNKQRFSALVRDKPLSSSWEKKMQAKREKDLVKQFTVRLKEEKAQKKEEKRKRREDNLKRRQENERKAEIVQVIRNTSKIKRMKKKQLRKIEKRDTLALLQKSQKHNVKTKTPKKAKQDFT
uniref:Coiled-coil domain-containing protein 86 n=1 Tax=Iconisemion striatum TaxID=60296 RepID=A0A1A7WW00_9TELE